MKKNPPQENSFYLILKNFFYFLKRKLLENGFILENGNSEKIIYISRKVYSEL